MSAELVRVACAFLAALLVFLWVVWMGERLHALASRAVALSLLLIFGGLSVGFLNAAYHHIQVNGVLYAWPFILGIVDSVIVYDLLFKPPRPAWLAALLGERQ